MATVRNLDFKIGFNIRDKKLLLANQRVNTFKSRLAMTNGTLLTTQTAATKAGFAISSAFARAKASIATGLMTLKRYKWQLLGIGAAGAAVMGIATKQWKDFEYQMTRVGQVADATTSQYKQLTQQTKELGIETAFTSKQAAEGQERLAMAGFEVNEILDTMPGILDLAAGAQMDLGKTSDITSNILRGFQLDASETERVVDVLSETMTSSNTRVAELGDAMKYAAPIVSSMGMSIEETAAAIGSMSNAGIKGSQAGRYLRTGMMRLISPTSQAKKELNNLGVELEDDQGKLKEFSGIIAEFEEGLEGMSKTQRMAALTQIFGRRSASGLISIINQGSSELRDFTTEIRNSQGATQELAEEQMDTLEGSFMKLKGSANVAGISLGKRFSKLIKPGVDAITGLINKFNEAPPIVKGVISTIITLGTVGALAGAGIGFIVTAAKWLAGTALFSGALPIMGIILGIGGLALIFQDLWTAMDGGDSVMAPIINDFYDFIGLNTTIEEQMYDLKYAMWVTWDFIKSFGQEGLPELTKIGKGIGDFFVGLTQGTVGFMKILSGSLRGLVTGDFDWMTDGYEQFIEGVKTAFFGLYDTITGIFSGIAKIWNNTVGNLLGNKVEDPGRMGIGNIRSEAREYGSNGADNINTENNNINAPKNVTNSSKNEVNIDNITLPSPGENQTNDEYFENLEFKLRDIFNKILNEEDAALGGVGNE